MQNYWSNYCPQQRIS